MRDEKGYHSILCYEIFTAFGLCSVVCGHTRGRMHNNTRTSTDTSDNSDTSTYTRTHRCHSCNFRARDGPGTDRELEFQGSNNRGIDARCPQCPDHPEV